MLRLKSAAGQQARRTATRIETNSTSNERVMIIVVYPFGVLCSAVLCCAVLCCVRDVFRLARATRHHPISHHPLILGPTVNLLCDEEGFQAESVGAGLVRRLISRWIRFLFWCCRRNPRALESTEDRHDNSCTHFIYDLPLQQVSCTCYRQWDTMEYMSCSGLLSFDPRGGCLRQMWLVVVMVSMG
ncbi:hypothetical protein HZ326_0499 [Fusarium oxysporum f. sp. albedinis]|nr:hypothetical protein HZ326_0499 [Fusarium oxysporum f. sp. albedinis]